MDLQPIAYTYGSKSFTGYLADGSGGQKAPGVLVVHEGGGLSNHAKDEARALAGLGYVAFAMDLYGQTGLALEQARALLMALREDLDELRGRAGAALAVLSGHAHADASRLAAIGFCFGGTTVLELARAGADLKAVVGFHAGLATSRPAAAGAIRPKVLACQGADDPIILAAERAAFEAEMTAAGADWQMLVLGGVGHSFTNPEVDALGFPGFVYDAVADRRSWAAMRALFDEVF
ncbi:MAG: dienelactone hydrolase family protein [Caulobacterales bacterium]|nr:dienelactone hydrolase family protein [Caulobacterales bacterium]